MAMPEEVVHLIMLTFMPASAIRHPHNGARKVGGGGRGLTLVVLLARTQQIPSGNHY